jgi:hypothetical protein
MLGRAHTSLCTPFVHIKIGKMDIFMPPKYRNLTKICPGKKL